MNTSKTTILSILVAGALGACSSGPTAGVQLMAVTSADSVTAGEPLIMEDAGNEPFQLGETLIYVRHIELDLQDDVSCGDVEGQLEGGALCDAHDDPSDTGNKIIIPGPFAVDLAAGTSQPSLAEVRVPAMSYRRVDVRVEDGDPAEGIITAGSPLDDRSFVTSSSFDYNGTPTALDISLKFNEDIRVEHPNGVDVAADEDLIAKFVVGQWLQDIDVITCLDDGDLIVVENRVVIDEAASGSGGCSGVEDTIKLNMKTSGQLDRD